MVVFNVWNIEEQTMKKTKPINFFTLGKLAFMLVIVMQITSIAYHYLVDFMVIMLGFNIIAFLIFLMWWEFIQ